NVEDVYTYHEEYEQNRTEIVNSVFDSINEINKEKKGEEKKDISPEQKVKKLKEKIPANIVNVLKDDGLMTLLRIPKDELDMAKVSTITAVHNIMSTYIPINSVNTARAQIVEELSYANVSENT